MEPPTEALTFPRELALQFTPHLPLPPSKNQPDSTANANANATASPDQSRPFVTLTFATSLDSSLALAPGVRTVLSGPQSKAMTHFLRSRHAAICVGVGTAEADDPGLNCRLALSVRPDGGPGHHHHPRPVVIDPRCRWAVTEHSKVLQLTRAGQGLAPFIVTAVRDPPAERRELLERHGGKFLYVEAAGGDGDHGGRFRWVDVLAAVKREGLDSIMIEGGGEVINSLLAAPDNELVDSVIVTIAPTWLGQGGVVVSPPRTLGADGAPTSPSRLTDVSWHPLGEDIVLCGKILR